jgi:hypothetical protein|tara:strand:- start:101 stop:943 length:843 start_codon:yes stop_codon:yes gene_type:complete
MRIANNCGYCYKEFFLTPADNRRRHENSKSGKLFCDTKCSGAYHKQDRIRTASKVRGQEAQDELENWFLPVDSSSNNIIGGGLATTDNIFYGGLNIQPLQEWYPMNSKVIKDLLAEHPEYADLTLAELAAVAPATPIPAAPVAPVAPLAPLAPAVPKAAPVITVPTVTPSTSLDNAIAVTGCDAEWWDDMHKKCAYNPELQKYMYAVVDPVEGYQFAKNAEGTDMPCYRCNSLGALTQRKLAANLKYDISKGIIAANTTLEAYTAMKKEAHPLAPTEIPF